MQVSPPDSGFYSCVAGNILGESVSSAYLEISPAPRPAPAPLPAKDNPYSELRGLAKGEAKEAPLYSPELGSLGLTTLHSPNTNTQQTFLACSAAVELATGLSSTYFPHHSKHSNTVRIFGCR